MRTALASRMSPFGAAAAIACLTVAIASLVMLAVTVSPAPVAQPLPYLDRGWFQITSGGFLVAVASWLRRRQEAVAYAVLAAACLLAGWGLQAIEYDFEAPQALVFVIRLVEGLALVPAPSAVIAAFASTEPRRLTRRSAWVLSFVVLLSVVAVIGQTAVREQDGNSYSGIGQTLVDWFSSATLTLAVLGVAIVGSVFNEARRFVPTTATAHRDPTVLRPLGYTMIAALLVAGAAVVAGLGGAEAGASRGHTLLPLLAVLVAIIGARWSTYVAWASVAISLAFGATVIFTAAVDNEVERYVADPDAWSPSALWLVTAGFSIATTVLGIVAATSALIEARRRAPSLAVRGIPGVLPLAGVATGVAAWATVAFLLGDFLPELLLEAPLAAWYMLTAVLGFVVLVGGAEAVRVRLVPAIAEAEATARRPLRPFRYLETVAIESLTARAAVRRTAMAAERSRLASDLHAQILPSLTDIRTRYESGAAPAEVADRLRRLEHEVRDLMAERRLVVLEEFGIVEAIEWLVGRAEERVAMDVQLSVDDRSTTLRPPREVERAAFRIAQLAVENALQHASPSRLELQVLARADEVRISVVDDGRGLDSPVTRRDRDHVGISDMRSQAAEVHGDVTVVSPATGGTMVTFAWPAA